MNIFSPKYHCIMVLDGITGTPYVSFFHLIHDFVILLFQKFSDKYKKIMSIVCKKNNDHDFFQPMCVISVSKFFEIFCERKR